MLKFAISDFADHQIELFSEKALSVDGVGIGQYHIKLLSDSDVRSYVKKYGYNEECVKSYFERSQRRKAFWKSESEYKVLFESKFSDKQDGNLIKIEEYFDKLNELLNFEYLPIINNDAIVKLKKTLENEKSLNTPTMAPFRIALLEETIWLFERLQKLTDDKGCDLDFVIISSRQFQSGFNKDAFKKIKIWFPTFKSSKKLSAAINVLENKQSREKFFYIFAPQNIRDKIECSELLTVISEFSQKFLES